MITEDHYARRMRAIPLQDDLERSNCPLAGQLGHSQCGWDTEFDLPVFLVGHTPQQREHFRTNLWKDYQP